MDREKIYQTTILSDHLGRIAVPFSLYSGCSAALFNLLVTQHASMRLLPRLFLGALSVSSVETVYTCLTLQPLDRGLGLYRLPSAW